MADRCSVCVVHYTRQPNVFFYVLFSIIRVRSCVEMICGKLHIYTCLLNTRTPSLCAHLCAQWRPLVLSYNNFFIKSKILPIRMRLFHILCAQIVWRVLNSNLAFTHFDPKKEMFVAGDASNYGIRGVLMHCFRDGTEKAVAHVSWSLTITEQNYSQIEKEALALVFCVKKFHMEENLYCLPIINLIWLFLVLKRVYLCIQQIDSSGGHYSCLPTISLLNTKTH